MYSARAISNQSNKSTNREKHQMKVKIPATNGDNTVNARSRNSKLKHWTNLSSYDNYKENNLNLKSKSKTPSKSYDKKP